MKLQNNNHHVFILIISCCLFVNCKTDQSQKTNTKLDTYPDIKIASAMKNVMWKGELESKIDIDSISDKRGLYGVGPLTGLTGELLIKDGVSYVSNVKDSMMQVKKSFKVSAPFFVYANVDEWKKIDLPDSISNIKHLEVFLDQKTKNSKRPFAFKLRGEINSAKIHVQNLPKGTKVSSPKEAHQGQTNYILKNEKVDIVGFFSTEHQGIFTHHDSFLHMHLITSDESKMGHLDEVNFGSIQLFLPER